MEYSKSLAHYGVMGMKWGVRRYQPYPKSVSGPSGKYTGPQKYSKRYEKKIAKIQKKADKAADYHNVNGGGFTDQMRKEGLKYKSGKVYMTPAQIKQAEKNSANQLKKKLGKLDAKYEKTVSKQATKEASKAEKERLKNRTPAEKRYDKGVDLGNKYMTSKSVSRTRLMDTPVSKIAVKAAVYSTGFGVAMGALKGDLGVTTVKNIAKSTAISTATGVAIREKNRALAKNRT